MKRNDPKQVWEDVTPAKAAAWLLKNVCNRPPKPAKIALWAEEMSREEWEQTHQGIAFDEDGNLMDGQNRLSAVVASGTTQRMSVTRGLKAKVFGKIDDGIARSGSDLFCVMYQRAHGEVPLNTNLVAAVAFAMLRGIGSGHGVTKIASSDHAMKHFALISEYSPIGRMPEAGSVVQAAFCNAALCFGPDAANPLFLRFKAQMWDTANDPMKYLHQRLSRARMRNEKRHAISKQEKYALTVAAIRIALDCRTHKGKGYATARLAPATTDFGPADKKAKNSA